VLFIIPTQLIAGIAAAGVTDGLVPGPLGVANKLGEGASIPQGLFLEMFLTAQLVLTVYFLAVEKHRGTYLAPVGIGAAVFVAHLAGTSFTGTSINPARSFGPAVLTGFPGYHWIYWVGPGLGALLAFGVYRLLKWLEYQTANPGQDAPTRNEDDAERGQTQGPGLDLERRNTNEPRSAEPNKRSTEGLTGGFS
jgi:aquaporin related protein